MMSTGHWNQLGPSSAALILESTFRPPTATPQCSLACALLLYMHCEMLHCALGCTANNLTSPSIGLQSWDFGNCAAVRWATAREHALQLMPVYYKIHQQLLPVGHNIPAITAALRH